MDKRKSAKVDAMIARLKYERDHNYREQALRLFPHVCARCGREFSGKRLRELTVHHRDHNHGNNPPDGSNWELLCLYCHDNEHQRGLEAGAHGMAHDHHEASTYKAFAGLRALLGRDED